MRNLFLICLLGIGTHVSGQTNTVTSGNWNDITVWSTGVVPVNTTNANVNHPLTINQSVTISTGDYTVNSNATDLPGGSAYNLSVGAQGVFDVYGYVVFEGTASTTGGGPSFATLIVRSGATLVLGATSINNKSTITVEPGGTLIVNGNLTIDDNQGSFTIGGVLQVNGNLSIPQGNIQIDGAGDVFTTGTVFSTGSSIIFGSTGDCDSGPCSGRNLCATFDNVIQASQTICSGATPALITNVDNDGVSGTAVYSWQQSTTSSSSGYSTIGSASTSTSTYQPPSLTATTWFRRVINDASCTGISAPVMITVIPGGGWIGTTSDWHTASNWCSNSVPDPATDVEITTGVPFQPVIGAGAVCRNLIINSGATVTINGSNTLEIQGNLTNNGILTVNTSTISFTGTSLQTISGTSLNIFNNLTINNTSGLTPGLRLGGINNVAVNNTLTLTAGLVDLNGYNLTVGSAAVSPGSIAYSAGRFYNGNLMRWYNATAKTLGSAPGFFPVGTATDYRPLYVGNAGLTTGGTIRVSHTGIAGSTNVAFTDGVAIQKRSNSFWSIATANGMAGGGNPFSLRAEGTGFGTIEEVTDLRLTQVSSAIGSSGANGGTILNPQVNRTSLPLTAINNDAFYIASIDGTNTPLPVELVSFKGNVEGTRVRLLWTTASELNNDFFTVERMHEESGFDPVARVNGSGTVHNSQSYFVYDQNPREGVNYYRLKQTDFDGTFAYSEIIAVEVKETRDVLKVYPNPSRQEDLTVELKTLKPGEQVRFTIFSGQQAQIFSSLEKADSNGSISLSIPTRGWASGVYILRSDTFPPYSSKIIIR
jgi:hypothetical protein